MFAIVITEKGGTERREVFEKDEINVGRVQGNDVLLPKGNVSKRHARLTFNNGRFVVTDLKSTNGTYVNGHRIAQATIIREGDKIYVGDFVLRLESVAAGSPPMPRVQADSAVSLQEPFAEVEHTLSRRVNIPSASDAPPIAVPEDESSPQRNTTVPRPIVPLITPPKARATSPSDSSGLSASTSTSAALSGSTSHGGGFAAMYQHALAIVVDRVEEMIDLSSLDDGSPPDEHLAERVDRALREQVALLRADGEIGSGVDPESLTADARGELCGLGPLASPLYDGSVSDLYVPHFNRIVAMRSSETRVVAPTFCNDVTLRRAIARLCRDAGEPILPGESIVTRHWGGASLHAILPPVAALGTTLTVHRPRSIEVALEDLVQSGVLSVAMATFLTGAVNARINVLVSGPRDIGASSLVPALARLGSSNEHSLVLHPFGEVWTLGTSGQVHLELPDAGSRGVEVVRAAMRLGAASWIVRAFGGEVAAAVLDAAAATGAGLIAFTPAATLRHSLDRLAPELSAARPGLTLEAARAWIAASFDLVIEVARLRDGRHRVLRIAETTGESGNAVGTRDLFIFVPERVDAGPDGTASGNGSFVPTGVVPRLTDELALRGYPVEKALFRSPSR